MPTTQDHALLILDVDDMLIYGVDPTEEHPEPPPPRIDFLTCGRNQIMKRPFVDEFLRRCFTTPLFKVAVWSKASEGHIHGVLDHLTLPHERQALKFVWLGDRCTPTLRFPDEWDDSEDRIVMIKDIKKVRARGYDLNRVLALDDTYLSWKRSYGNLVHIRPFTGDVRDEELPRVWPFLEQWFQDPRGVRQIEKRFWDRRK